MRILSIVHDHANWTTGGTEIAAEALARGLSELPGVDVRTLAVATRLHRPDAIPGRLGAEGRDHVLCTGSYDRFSMLRHDGTDWIASLGRVLDAVRPQIVHLHGVDRIGAEAVPALRRLAPRARVVLTLHDYQLICPNDGLMLTRPEASRCTGANPDRCRRCFPEIGAARHALRRAHLLALLAGVHRFVAPSRFLRDRFVAWGLAPERIAVIPNATNLGPRRRTSSIGGRDRPNRFAFFGNLSPHKGVLVLLEAARRLKIAGAAVEIAVHGGFGHAGPAFRDEVMAAVAAADPVARFLGPYDRDDVLGHMQRSDWVVVPSLWWENAPLTLAEARAAARPVIVSGHGGLAELVRDGIDGLHVPAGDPLALADALARAAGDAALWRRLATAGRATRFEDHVTAHAALFESLFERVAA